MQIDFPFIWIALKEIVRALPMTLLIAFVPIVLGVVIGTVTAFVRISTRRSFRFIFDFYVSFFRGTPVVLHIFLIYFGLPIIAKQLWQIDLNGWPIVIFVLMALTLNAGAFLSEIIRSGILSVSKQEVEAGTSLGMTTVQVYGRIILPQAFVTIIPNVTNMVIAFLHASSIAFLVSVQELTGAADIIASSNLKYLEAFIAVGIIYWLVTIMIEIIANQIERKMTAHLRQGVVQS